MTKLTHDMIDPQLRAAGRITTLMARPSKVGFRFLNWMMERAKGLDIEGADSRTVWVTRSDGDGTIRVRVFRPKNTSQPLPIVLFFHGGGYALGVPEQGNLPTMYKQLMETRPCVIVAPDYRLSLHAPYPAGLNDCYDTLLWAKEHADEIGGNTNQIFVMGDSAGAGMTAAISLMARDRGEVKLAFQMPLYPMLDDRPTPSSAENEMPVWNRKHNKVGWELYLRGLVAQGAEIPAYAAPARATNYAGLPPTATFIGALDLFLHETQTYVANLKAAGVPVQFEVFEGCYHGFEQIVPSADQSQAAFRFLYDAFAHAVDNYFTVA